MVSTFLGLDTAVQGILLNQAQLDVTANNVDNASTPGYSRQTGNVVSMPYLSVPGEGPISTQLGTGAQVASVTRIRNAFLDTQYRQANSALGQWTVMQTTMNQVSSILDEPSNTGLSTMMQNFWSAWSQLGSNPGNLSAAQQLQQNAVTLTDTLNQMGNQYNQLTSDLNTQLNATITQVNTDLATLANLNGQIAAATAAGSHPNDLMDQRDLLLDQLSNLVDISTTTASDGTMSLTIGTNGSPAVVGSTVKQELVPDGGQASSSSVTAIYPSSTTSGQIRGIEDSLTKVNAYASDLDTFAQQLANGPVNVTLDGAWQFPLPPGSDSFPVSGTLPNGTTFAGAGSANPTSVSAIASNPANGVTVDKSVSPPLVTVPAGTIVQVNGINGLLKLGYSAQGQVAAAGFPDFFTAGSNAAAGTPITAANITVGVSGGQVGFALQPQVTQSGSSSTWTSSDPALSGDGTLAMTASDVANAKFNFNNPADPSLNMSGTLNQFLQGQVGEIGIQAQTANHEVTTQTNLVQQVDNQRQSVSGVDLNEEMANMLKYQQGYNASAKIVETIQSMFDTLMNEV
ncbi:MAG: flagellar hook-associated protein FlgK [Alicyclobacillus sp.]|nr:flagellar hook-associated protein FlgK [Alicyclobacillus sp.]